MTNLTELQSLVHKLDVPEHKLNLTKPTNVIWLLQNLRSRNAQRPEFSQVMRGLLDHATQHKLMKAKELAELHKGLQ